MRVAVGHSSASAGSRNGTGGKCLMVGVGRAVLTGSRGSTYGILCVQEPSISFTRFLQVQRQARRTEGFRAGTTSGFWPFGALVPSSARGDHAAPELAGSQWLGGTRRLA